MLAGAKSAIRIFGGENFGEWSAKNTDIEYSVNLRKKTLAIAHQFFKFANVFSYPHFCCTV